MSHETAVEQSALMVATLKEARRAATRAWEPECPITCDKEARRSAARAWEPECPITFPLLGSNEVEPSIVGLGDVFFRCSNICLDWWAWNIVKWKAYTLTALAV
jgi:hypothetical protein